MAQINKPSDYFNTVLYTGTGSAQSITGVGFQPDYTVIKQRSGTEWHENFDVVRGTNKQLYWNETNAEGTDSNKITSFDSDGFSLGTANGVNQSLATYVGWNWLAGGTPSSNTDGSITSQVSANTTSGFSIVSYTGTGNADSVGHGLSQKPDIAIIKRRDGATNWIAYTDVIDGSFDYLLLNTTAAKGDASSFTMDSDTLNIEAGSTSTNVNGSPYISYCFHSVKGYSKIGKYVGNGSTDGTFVFCGFKPAFVIGKITSDLNEWFIMDSTRSTFNVANKSVYANTSGAENTNHNVDFLSNGFKLRDSDGTVNLNNGSYIYIAFAENPLVGSNNVCATAR